MQYYTTWSDGDGHKYLIPKEVRDTIYQELDNALTLCLETDEDYHLDDLLAEVGAIYVESEDDLYVVLKSSVQED